MSYTRVIPRDLFNEADLLKCYGQLYINLDYLGMAECLLHMHPHQPFYIYQDPSDGSLTLENVKLIIRGALCHTSRPLNSREPYPLYALLPDGETISVFESDGEFTQEMIDFLVPDKE